MKREEGIPPAIRSSACVLSQKLFVFFINAVVAKTTLSNRIDAD